MDDARKLVLITGCSYGLGEAMVQAMIAAGNIVLGCSRSPEKIDAMQQRWPAPHRFDAVDVGDDQAVAQWGQAALASHGPPHILLNNAGIGQREARPLWQQSADDFRRVLATNLEGQANVIRHFLPAMMRLKRGVVVNFSSGWGRETAAKQSLYCASKWGVEGMTRALAQELPPHMTAVTLHPGIINTPGLQKAFKQDAELYPTLDQWAAVAAPYILQISRKDNGQPLEVPGMPGYQTPKSRAPAEQASR